ncbi:hypothetical protein Golomagni_05879, partial [Golovinomyces magnicellulatus]
MESTSSKNDNTKYTLWGLMGTLIPTFTILTLSFGAFLFLRKSQRRFYAPRTYLGTLREEERPKDLPKGWINWIGPFIRIPTTSVLNSQSLDAYLSLRFLKMTVIILVTGALITWPILLPVYVFGGSGNIKLDSLSTGNISTNGTEKHRYYATTFVGFIYFTFILLIVTRESIFFVNLRQAFLLSPSYASKISSRTVLFISVPKKYQDEAELRQIYGPSVKRVWLTRDTASVDGLVNERDKVALQLEAAEIELLKTANIERHKFKKNRSDQSTSTNTENMAPEGNLEAGSLSARWVPEKKRPTLRLGLFGLLGHKVDTINSCRSRLETLIRDTLAAQNSYKRGDSNKTGGVFIEFNRLTEAQNAVQTLTHHHVLQMTPRFIGINPEEVIWPSLKLSWYRRIIRRLTFSILLLALMILWAVPVGFVGLLTKVNYFEKYYGLHKISGRIRGIISGLPTAVAIRILMFLAPRIMRALAELSGVPSLSHAELFTQYFYFIFEAGQLFFIATLTPAIILFTTDSKQNEKAIKFDNIVAEIPYASNFYFSYFLVQGLTLVSGSITQATGFIIFSLMYKLSVKTPRYLYEKWVQMSSISWGSTLAVYTNIAVIGITYSCIAPLTLGFAAVTMFISYWALRYHVIFVNDSPIDTKGLIYPRALQQLLTGVYLAEICLIVIFGISHSYGPIVLMSIFLIFTLLYHRCLNTALEPFCQNLPRTLIAREEAIRAERFVIESGENGASHETISEN